MDLGGVGKGSGCRCANDLGPVRVWHRFQAIRATHRWIGGRRAPQVVLGQFFLRAGSNVDLVVFQGQINNVSRSFDVFALPLAEVDALVLSALVPHPRLHGPAQSGVDGLELAVVDASRRVVDEWIHGQMVSGASGHLHFETERGILGQLLLQGQLAKKLGTCCAMASVVRGRCLLEHLLHGCLDLLLVTLPEDRVGRRLQVFVDRGVGLRQAATGDLLHFGGVQGATKLPGILEVQVLRSSLRDGCHDLEAGAQARLVLQLNRVVGLPGCSDLLERETLFSRSSREERVLLVDRHVVGR